MGRCAPDQQRQVDDVGDFDRLSGLERFGAARLPALTMGEDMTFAPVPIENFGGQASHRPRTHPFRRLGGAPKRAKHDERKADKHSRSDADHPP